MATDTDQSALQRLRLRTIILCLTLAVLAFLAWVSMRLTGEVHVGLWIAIIFVGVLLGFTLWAIMYVYGGFA